MDQTFSTVITVITLAVGIAGLMLNYRKFAKDNERNLRLDQATEADRAADKLKECEQREEELELDVLTRERLIAKLMLNQDKKE